MCQVWSKPQAFAYHFQRYEFTSDSWLGQVAGTTYCSFPIAAVLAALAPFSIASFTGYRFPIWTLFAWTALIAVELAYYLR